MSISSEISKTEQYLSAAYTKASQKGATIPSHKNMSNLASTIDTITGGGGGSSTEIVVTFIDYDGTVLHEYTKDQADALSSLPSNPTHTGLVALGWNWTLAKIKEQIADGDHCVVGQMYDTTDSKTRLYIDVTQDTSKEISMWLTPKRVSGAYIEVDWGDNTTPTKSYYSSITPIECTHTYANIGEYVVTIDTNEAFSFVGNSDNGSWLLNSPLAKKGTYLANSGYLSMLQKVEIGSNCEGLLDGSFCRMSALKTVSCPNTIKTLGNGVFYYCYGLSGFVLPTGIVDGYRQNLFNCCTGLTYASLPYDLNLMGQHCFSSCFSLKEAVVPSSVGELDGYMFNMQASAYNSTGRRVFKLNRYTSLGGNIFEYNKRVTEVDLSKTTASTLPAYTFRECSSLVKVTLPTNCTSLGQYAFSGCSSLKDIDLSNIKTYAQYALDGTSIEEVTLGSNVTSIGNYPFRNCRALKKADLSACTSLTGIGTYTFSECWSLKDVKLPPNITSIPTYMFSNCYALQNITIPSRVTSMAGYAFSDCYAMTEIDYPDAVTNLNTAIFRRCYGLTTFTVKSNINTIYANALNNCQGLKKIIFFPQTPPTCQNTSAFAGIPTTCVIEVPPGTLNAYKTATNYPNPSTYTYVEWGN